MKRLCVLAVATAIVFPSLLLAGDSRDFQIPDEFKAGADVLRVERKLLSTAREPLKFGDFQVVDHHVGWAKGKSEEGSILPAWIPVALDAEATNEKWQQQFRFTLASGGAPKWGCLCKIKGRSEGLLGVKTSVDQEVTCKMIDAGDMTKSWQFTLRGHTGAIPKAHQQGEVTAEEVRISIDPVEAKGRATAMWGPAGFTIAKEDVIQAAVDVTSKGRVSPPGPVRSGSELLRRHRRRDPRLQPAAGDGPGNYEGLRSLRLRRGLTHA